MAITNKCLTQYVMLCQKFCFYTLKYQQDVPTIDYLFMCEIVTRLV